MDEHGRQGVEISPMSEKGRKGEKERQGGCRYKEGDCAEERARRQKPKERKKKIEKKMNIFDNDALLEMPHVKELEMLC